MNENWTSVDGRIHFSCALHKGIVVILFNEKKKVKLNSIDMFTNKLHINY